MGREVFVPSEESEGLREFAGVQEAWFLPTLRDREFFRMFRSGRSLVTSSPEKQA